MDFSAWRFPAKIGLFPATKCFSMFPPALFFSWGRCCKIYDVVAIHSCTGGVFLCDFLAKSWPNSFGLACFEGLPGSVGLVPGYFLAVCRRFLEIR